MAKAVNDAEVTKIVNEAEGVAGETPTEPTKGKRGRGRNASKSATATKKDVGNTSEQLATIFNVLSKFLQSATTYTANDFSAESEIIEQLKSKYQILATIFEFIAPVILLLQLYTKFEAIRQNTIRQPPVNMNNGVVENG